MAGLKDVVAIQMELIIKLLRDAESRRNRYGRESVKLWTRRFRSVWRSVRRGKDRRPI
jgi:hypothetical protein